MVKENSCNHREATCKSDAIWRAGDLSKTNTGCQDKSEKDQSRTMVYKFSLLYFKFPLPTKFGKLVYVILKPDSFFQFKSLLISFGEFTEGKGVVRSTLKLLLILDPVTQSTEKQCLKSSAKRNELPAHK